MKDVVDGILDATRHAIVVLRTHEHDSHRGERSLGPASAMLMCILLGIRNHGRDDGLIVCGELELGYVYRGNGNAVQVRLALDCLLDEVNNRWPDAGVSGSSRL